MFSFLHGAAPCALLEVQPRAEGAQVALSHAQLVLGAERKPRLEMRFGRIVVAVGDRNGCEIGVCTGHMFLEAAAQRQLQTALELEPSGVAGRHSARRADVIECVRKDLVVTELPGELDRTLTPLDGARVL